MSRPRPNRNWPNPVVTLLVGGSGRCVLHVQVAELVQRSEGVVHVCAGALAFRRRSKAALRLRLVEGASESEDVLFVVEILWVRHFASQRCLGAPAGRLKRGAVGAQRSPQLRCGMPMHVLAHGLEGPVGRWVPDQAAGPGQAVRLLLRHVLPFARRLQPVGDRLAALVIAVVRRARLAAAGLAQRRGRLANLVQLLLRPRPVEHRLPCSIRRVRAPVLRGSTPQLGHDRRQERPRRHRRQVGLLRAIRPQLALEVFLEHGLDVHGAHLGEPQVELGARAEDVPSWPRPARPPHRHDARSGWAADSLPASADAHLALLPAPGSGQDLRSEGIAPDGHGPLDDGRRGHLIDGVALLTLRREQQREGSAADLTTQRPRCRPPQRQQLAFGHP